jgi:hypothetical protein
VHARLRERSVPLRERRERSLVGRLPQEVGEEHGPLRVVVRQIEQGAEGLAGVALGADELPGDRLRERASRRPLDPQSR